jgi:hypothetical protein
MITAVTLAGSIGNSVLSVAVERSVTGVLIIELVLIGLLIEAESGLPI